MFEVTPPSRLHARAALERLLFLFGVVPVLVAFLPLYAVLWGPAFAATHGLFLIVAGGFVMQLALGRKHDMPCARPWDPQSLDLGRWWGAYLVGFILYTTKLPELELELYGHPLATTAFLAMVASAGVLLRVRSLRRLAPDQDVSAFAPGDVLSLN